MDKIIERSQHMQSHTYGLAGRVDVSNTIAVTLALKLVSWYVETLEDTEAPAAITFDLPQQHASQAQRINSIG